MTTFMGRTGVWTQDFMLARQVIYHMLFCSGYFGDGILLFAQAGLDLDPLL
jgi:hypothetical protein